jgi:hypothetical protein
VVTSIPKKQWLIRDQSGKIIGPYTKEAIRNLAARGIISGDEQIASHPGGQWVLLASIPEFYDLVIESLENFKNESPGISSSEKMEANTIIPTRVQPGKRGKHGKQSSGAELDGEATKVATSHFSDLTRTIKTGFSNLSKTLYNIAGKKQSRSQKPFDRTKFVPIDTRIPTMTTNGTSESAIRVSNSDSGIWIFRFVLVAALISGVVFYISESILDGNGLSGDGKIHLLAPLGQNGYLTPDESKAYLMKVKSSFERDNISNWIEAQNLLIKIAEAEPTNTEAR